MPSDNITFTLSMEFRSIRELPSASRLFGDARLLSVIAVTRLYDDDQEGYLVFSRLATIIGTWGLPLA
jgi:hypothetical protein